MYNERFLLSTATVGPPIFSIAHQGEVHSGDDSDSADAKCTRNNEFVVTMVDLDAPTPQNQSLSQIRHFLGGDFTQTRNSGGLLSNSTPALSNFLQPTPPAGSDPHRYACFLFLLYTSCLNFCVIIVMCSCFSISHLVSTSRHSSPPLRLSRTST